jgi:hypothetical protein
MNDGCEQQKVTGPIVDTEIIEVLVRPVSRGTVPQRHHQAEKQVQRDETDGYQADIGGKIDGGDHRFFSLLRCTRIAEILRDKIVFSGTPLG